MNAIDLYNLFAPIFKAHPSLIWALLVSMLVSAVWSKTPPSWKAKLHALPYVGVRLAGVLDLLVAATPTAPKVWDAFVKGVVLGQVKPSVASATAALAAASVPPGIPPTNASER